MRSLRSARDGRWLSTCHTTGPARLWPVTARDGEVRDVVPNCGWVVADTGGQILVHADGRVFLGPAPGGAPRVLFEREDLGHEGPVHSLAVSPDEKWIATSSDESISIWPMPDVTKPPLHTLPHAELLARVDALSNLRVVRDPTAATGWKLDIGPSPGWKDVPSW
jgi:WD40 repeat protein